MADRTYVFRLVGDSSGLLTASEAGGRAVDLLASKTESATKRGIEADRQATAARNDLAKATTALGATSFQSLSSATTSLGASGWVAQAKAAEKQVDSLGKTSKLAAYQTQQLGYQLNDFFVQVSSGQSPLTALIQQGSQLSGTFGGIGGAARAVLGLLTPMVIGIGAVAAVVGSVALAWHKGAEEDRVFRESLALTNNFAGVTRDSFNQMAASIASLPRNAIGPTKQALQELVSTGRFTSESLASVGRAVVAMANVTGRQTADIVKDFASQRDGVAKWAIEANKQYHYVTAAQIDYIRSLEAQGKVQQAVAINAHLLTTALEKAKGQVGLLEGAWDGLKKKASEAWAAMLHIGQEDTTGDRLASIRGAIAEQQRRLEVDQSKGSGNQAQVDIRRANIARLQAIEEGLRLQSSAEARAAQDQSANAAAEERKIEDSSAAHQQALGSIELAGFQRRAAQAEYERQQIAIGIQRGYEAGNVTLAGYLDWQYKLRRAAFTDQMALLDQEAAAIKRVPVSTPTETIQREAQLVAVGTKRIAVLQEIAKLEEQRRKGELLPDKLLDTQTDTGQQQFNRFEHDHAEETSATIARMVEDRGRFIESLRQQSLEVDKEVGTLDAERLALGQSSIERQKGVAIAKLWAQAQKDIAANGSETPRILAEYAKNVDKLTTALQSNYDASRSFETGVTSAFSRYRDEAANSAQFADRVITGGLGHAEDALTAFVQTGKLKLGDLWKFMADEFIRNWIRMQIAQATSSNSGVGSNYAGGLLGAIGSIVGAFAGSGYNYNGDAAGTQFSSSGSAIAARRALGGDVAGGQAVMVGEHGPEIAVFGRQGGRVLSNSQLRASAGKSSGGGNLYITNVGTNAQVSSAQQDEDGHWYAVLEQVTERAANLGAQRGHALVAKDLAGGSGRASQALKSRGVSLLGGAPKRA